jgi:hypothetical protein
MPEQSISSPNTLVQGHPSLAARRAVVFANLRSLVEQPRAGTAVARSRDRGQTWFHQGGFPLVDSNASVTPPTSGLVLSDNAVLFACAPSPVQTFRGLGAEPIVWEPASVAIPYVPTSNSRGYDGTALASHPDGLRAYVIATETFDTMGNEAYVRFARSLDGGANWIPSERLSGPTCMGPSVAVGANDGVHVGWVDYLTGSLTFTTSTTDGVSFNLPRTASAINDNLGTPPFGWGRHTGNERPLDYPTYRKTNLAPNFPALAVDRSVGATRGNLYLVWAEYADGTISPATNSFAVGSGNMSFATALVVPLDSDASGSMPEIHVSNTSRYVAFDGVAGQTVWIDGTASPNQHAYDFIWEMADGTRITSHSGYLTSGDPAFGRTAPTILTLPHSGRYYLRVFPPVGSSLSFQFRIRTYQPAAASASRDMRDIVLIRSTDGGQTWSSKIRVNHDPAGADQHQPNVAVDEQGHVYVAWYDRRGIPAGDSVNAYASVSSDGGLTFGPDLRLSSRPSGWGGAADPEFQLLPGQLIGERIAIAAGDSYGIVAWTDLRNWPARSDIYAARIVDAPTAVSAVSDLDAVAVSGGVRLTWFVNDPRGVSGLRVHRSEAGGPESPVSDDLSPGSRPEKFEYLDSSAAPGRTYSYRLEVRSGTSSQWLGPVEVVIPQSITALACRAIGPNPFSRGTSLALAVPRAAHGVVRIYDVQGKEVRTLAEGPFEPGERTLAWDGRDASGGPAAPGIYFVSAEVGGEHARLRIARVP